MARSSRESALGRSPWRRASTAPPRGNYEARGVINHLGNPEPFFSEGPAFGECAQLSMTPGEPGTGLNGGQDDLTEAFVAPCTVEGRHGLPEAVDRSTIVALDYVDCAEVLVRLRL